MSPADLTMWTFGTFSAVLGLLLGSFLNVCIVRLPEDRSIVTPRSHCPVCGTTLHPLDLIPVVSWLRLGGKCRSCSTPISPLYPLIEGLTGVLAWLLFRKLIPDTSALDLAHGAAWTVFFLFFCLLIVQTYIDVRYYIIPDETSIYAVPIGVGSVALLEFTGYSGWLAIGWREAVVGALVGGVVLGGVSQVWVMLFREEGLGWGDVKLFAMVGSFLGPLACFYIIFVTSLFALVGGVLTMIWRRTGVRSVTLPLGPYLAFAAMTYVLYGDEMSQLLPGVQTLLSGS